MLLCSHASHAEHQVRHATLQVPTESRNPADIELRDNSKARWVVCKTKGEITQTEVGTHTFICSFPSISARDLQVFWVSVCVEANLNLSLHAVVTGIDTKTGQSFRD
jgi:hypothetical protein